VVVEVGQRDLFPYRIQYLRRRKSGRGGGSAGDRGSSAGNGSDKDADTNEAEQQTTHDGYRAIVTLELFDVHVNVQIDPRQFTFQAPAGTPVTEATEGYLKSLNLAPAAK
jgi:hypothetical protein